MENKIYYIKGSMENPEGVKQALLEICPNAENIDDFVYRTECHYYYAINDRIAYAYDIIHIKLLKQIGTELQPKKAEKFVERTMYSPIIKILFNNKFFQSFDMFASKEDAMRENGAVGYCEVKVMIKKG